MAFIDYLPKDQIPAEDDIPDEDHILRIHSVHSPVMRLHYDLYLQLMHRGGPLTKKQKELIAVVISSRNGCVY